MTLFIKFHTHCALTPLKIVFQEQSYSHLHSIQSLAWDHFTALSPIPGALSPILRQLAVMRWRLEIVQVLMTIIARLIKHCLTSWNTYKTSWNSCKTLWSARKTSWNTHTRKTLWNVMKHSNTSRSGRRYSLSMPISAAGRSFRRYFGDCSVGITLQICNRISNPWDVGNFSRPVMQQEWCHSHSDVLAAVTRSLSDDAI